MKEIKKIAIYGDSISTVNHGEGGYEGSLKEYFGAETVNYAISASGLSYITPDNTVSILQNPENIPEDADVILMWHGSNDWYWGSPIGELEDREPDTFLGAVRTAVARIRRKAPRALLAWVTPLFRYEKPDGGEREGRAYEIENKVGNALGDYCHALWMASVYYGFPLIDMRRLSGIHEENQEFYLEDRVHPNKAGYEKISRVLIKSIEELLL